MMEMKLQKVYANEQHTNCDQESYLKLSGVGAWK